MPSLMDRGLELMAMGMGTVFVFLTLLVVATTLMSRLVNRLFPVSDVESVIAADSPDPQTVAAITAALQIHKNKIKKPQEQN